MEQPFSVTRGSGTPLRRKRAEPASMVAPIRVRHRVESVVKPFGKFGGWDMAKLWLGVFLMAAELVAPHGAWGRLDAGQTPTIAEKTAGAQKLAGYFNLYWDAKQGKLWLEIDKWGSEFLYQSGLPAGIGSNDIGLEREQVSATGIGRFERSGPKVLLIADPMRYWAFSDYADEWRDVHDSF